MNVREAIRQAVGRRKVPHFDPSSIHNLALQLGMSPPVSLTALLTALDSLPLATVTFSSGPLTANYVHGSAQLGLQSDGLVSFKGQVHESGLVGDNYQFVAALLDVVDSSGNTPAFVHTYRVAGQSDLLGSHDDQFQTDRKVNIVEAQWSAAKSSRVEWRLHASTDPVEVTADSVGNLFPGSGFVIGAIFESGVGGDSSDGTVCHWAPDDTLLGCEKP